MNTQVVEDSMETLQSLIGKTIIAIYIEDEDVTVTLNHGTMLFEGTQEMYVLMPRMQS